MPEGEQWRVHRNESLALGSRQSRLFIDSESAPPYWPTPCLSRAVKSLTLNRNSLSDSRLASLLLCVPLGCGGLTEDNTSNTDSTDSWGGAAGSVQVGNEADAAQDEGWLYDPGDWPLGRSHPQWVAEYWKWHLSLSRSGHPREGGVCTQGQDHEEVWFLTTGRDGQEEYRSCTIPQGHAILLLANSRLDFPRVGCQFCDETVLGPSAWGESVPARLREMREELQPNSVFASIDGEALAIDEQFFWSTEEPFVAAAPADDPYFDCTEPLLEETCGWDAGPREFIAVAYAAMLRPLSPGAHVLQFGSRSPSGDWQTDVTYEIHVE